MLDYKYEIEKLIKQRVNELIETNIKRLRKLKERHEKKKGHFMPVELRVVGGYLQSLNIRYGNLIEKLLEDVIGILFKYGLIKFNVVTRYSGKKLNLKIEENCLKAINDYIQEGKIKYKANPNEVSKLFDKMFKFQNNPVGDLKVRKLDVNFLIDDRKGNYYYLEVKYCDDHDTGKFVSINRKFLYTFAGLIYELKIPRKEKFKPILYYFDDGLVKYENVFLIEGVNVLRGKALFELFDLPEIYDIVIKALDPENYEDSIRKSIKPFIEKYL